MDNGLSPEDWQRYQRQLALPDIMPEHQTRLQETGLAMIGAGGLGCAALPYLAGAGIGNITVIDHDAVRVSNLHRQTIFTKEQEGRNKAELAAQYLKNLNPAIKLCAITEKITPENAKKLCNNFNLILDGSDNFQTKTLLNEISIQTKTPLISASISGFEGTAGLFAGYAKNAPCYACLFPDLPADAPNCNEAGILGTSAGLAGLYQAHLVLCYLLDIGGVAPGTLLSFKLDTLRINKLRLQKDLSCSVCKNEKAGAHKKEPQTPEIKIIPPRELNQGKYILVDVRTMEEIQAHPFDNAQHIPLHELPARYRELPKDQLLAFACAANMRSMQAAQFMRGQGYENVCVYDVLAA